MIQHPQNAHVTRREDGFVLLAVLFMLVLVVLALAIAAPKVASDLQRDKEIETMHRGMQYRRAIQIYYKKFGGYPTSIDQLMNTGGQRFLRKRYLDPLTGKDDWRLIHLGEATVPSLGPFGQPVAGSGSIPGATPAGAANPMGSGFGSSSSGFGSSSSGSSGSSFGSSGSGVGSSNSGSSNSIFGSSGGLSSSGNSSLPLGGGSSTGTGTGTGTGSSTGAGSTGSSSFGATLGGGPIVGVGLLSTKASIKIFKKQTHYNKWEFVYNPNEDLGGGGALGQGGAQPTGSTGINGTSTGIGGSGTSGFGGTSGSPGSGSPPTTTPTAPTNPFGGTSSPQ